MIYILLRNFPNALRPVSDAIVNVCNRILDSCTSNADNLSHKHYSDSQLTSISNALLTATAMKRGFDANMIHSTIKLFLDKADAVLDLFVNEEWLALQTDIHIGLLATSFNRLMKIVEHCLVWAREFHASICINDFKSLLSKFARATDNVKKKMQTLNKPPNIIDIHSA
jgi:hypothetical protein